MSGPLDGIRILDIGLLVQGPQAAALLSDMGADVIKIELPRFGDQARRIRVAYDDSRSAYFFACNRGKRSLTLDLRTPEGANVMLRLVETADVVVSNFKPGTLDDWGLGYEDLAASNSRIILAAGSAFGSVGPDAEREGADLGGQAAGGLISTTGRDGDPPTPVGVTIADHIGSQNMVSGILAALYSRERTGRGQKVDVSLLGGQIWAQAAEYSHYLMTGENPGRANYGHALIHSIYRIFETADGWIGIIGVPAHTKDAFFVAVERPELSVDPRFQRLLMKPQDRAWLVAELENIFVERTTDDWCKVLEEAGVRYAPVRDYQEVVDDPGAWENGYFSKVMDSTGSPRRVVGTPIRMSDTPLAPAAEAPELGAHSEEVLLEAGYSIEEIERLRAASVV